MGQGLNLASGEGRLVDGKVTLMQVPAGALRVHVATLDSWEFEGDVTVTSGKTASVTLEAVEEEWD